MSEVTQRWSKEGEFAEALQNGTTLEQQLAAKEAENAELRAMIATLGENAAKAAKEYSELIAAEREKAEKFRAALQAIAKWRDDANSYDNECDNPPRIYCEDVELIEAYAERILARATLAETQP